MKNTLYNFYRKIHTINKMPKHFHLLFISIMNHRYILINGVSCISIDRNILKLPNYILLNIKYNILLLL